MNKIATLSPLTAEQSATGSNAQVATLYCEERSRAVVIRAFSSSGALVEAARLPPTGSPVILRRGTLQIRGKIAWSEDLCAGIEFNTPATVAEWTVQKPHKSQQIVDEIVAAYHRGEARDEGMDAAPEEECIRSQLRKLQAELSQLGNSLISDVILVATHPEIQLLDIAVQRVERVLKMVDNARAVTSTTADTAESGISADQLRGVCEATSGRTDGR
ncbi:hypothetical protein [Sphingomonas xanthus]|uniref:PilZ domain-containing protein n=1 Tax=Sphingomonas xanthus TaxID=2594473 RepID=A0A516IU48_9SPHN|nr:hypothetical protein [Sphingomonas xanthus]QDP20427.1 hypothetical protein FMM02_10960 [Sphingomonas xanthus]